MTLISPTLLFLGLALILAPAYEANTKTGNRATGYHDNRYLIAMKKPVELQSSRVVAGVSAEGGNQTDQVSSSVSSRPSHYLSNILASPTLELNRDSEVRSNPCPTTTSDQQLLAYVSGIESLTATMQDLDDAVQQIKPGVRSCAETVGTYANLDEFRESNMGHSITATITTTTASSTMSNPATGNVNPATIIPGSGSLESPIDGRQPEPPFGLPRPTSDTQADDDLAKAAADLRSLKRDLGNTSDWLRQTHHNIHSAMLRALIAYVTSIERRVEQQRQLISLSKTNGLKIKVASIKVNVAKLMDKLRTIVPFKESGGARRGSAESS